MDSLTQIVLGAAVGEYFLGRKIGNRALLYGAIIATIPDLDVIVGKLFDPITAVEMHRGFSHSIIFFLLFSPILGYSLKKVERKANFTFKEATLMAFFSLFTHALLDSFTTWGTQLFWPFGDRIAWKTIFVVDPLYTIPFLICLIVVMRLPKDAVKRRKWNIAGIVISSSYLLLSVVAKNVAQLHFEKALTREDIKYEQIIVKPSPLNIILWNANIKTDDGYFLADYSFFDHSPITFDYFDSGEEYITDIEDSEIINRLKKISEGWYVISVDGNKTYFNDLRFGLLNDDVKNPEFVFKYEILNKRGELYAIEADNKGKKEGKKILQRLINRIGGK